MRAALALLAIVAAALPAYAQMHCDRRAKVVAHLGMKYGETVRSTGIAGTGHIIEVFASSGGTFTVLATTPRGVSCLVASGRDWERVRPPEWRCTGPNCERDG